MTSRLRMWIAGVMILAMGTLIYESSSSQAGDTDLRPTVRKIALAFKKDDSAGAKRLAEAAAKNIGDTGEIMHMFKLRSKGGMGIGPKPANKTTDGIEVRLRGLASAVP